MVTKIIGILGETRYEDENGKLHRDDGPAEIYLHGNEYWYRHGKIHREDGPAISWEYKTIFKWVLMDVEYSFERWCEITEKTDEEIVELKLKYG